MNQCLLMSPDCTSKDKDSFRKCLQGGAATVGDGEPEAPGWGRVKAEKNHLASLFLHAGQVTIREDALCNCCNLPVR